MEAIWVKKVVSRGTDFSRNPATKRTQTQEVWAKKALSEDSPKGLWTVNSILGPQKRDIVSVTLYTQSYRCITCNKINKRLCTQYTKHPDSHSTAVGSAKPLSVKHFTGK